MRSGRLAAVAALTLSLTACGGDTPTGPSSTASTGTTTSSGGASHNAGRDCGSCHSFTAAGTVYRSDGVTVAPGTVIRLTTEPGGAGTVLVTLTADRSGNFYTNTAIPQGGGVFATATTPAGATRAKSAAVTSGRCNSCHVSGSRLVVD